MKEQQNHSIRIPETFVTISVFEIFHGYFLKNSPIFSQKTPKNDNSWTS